MTSLYGRARRRRLAGLARVGIAAGAVSGFAAREHAHTAQKLTAH